MRDLTAYLGFLIGNADIYDISETGVCFTIATPDREFTVGETIYSDIYLHNDIALQKVPLTVVRHTAKSIGCQFKFENKERMQEIHSLIENAVMHEQYLKDKVDLQFDDDKRLKMREHNLL